MSMPNALTFLESVAGYNQQIAKGEMGSASEPVRLAVIDPAYVANTYPATLPKVTFEGEDTLSDKRYPVIGSYMPKPSARVVMLPVGHTYVIMGDLNSAGGESLGRKVNTQLWASSTGNVALTTSFALFSAAETCTIVKKYAGTRIIGHLDLGFNNPDGTIVTYYFGLYCPGASDAVGRWEVMRYGCMASNRDGTSGTRELGPAGEYAAGSLEFKVAVKASVSHNIEVQNNQAWAIDLQEVW